MKKIALFTLLLVSTFSFAQEDENIKKHEIKINSLSLIITKSLDVSYEYLINEEASLGISLFKSFDDNIDYYKIFSLTPYYRRYFSKGYAKGFFIEGFGMLNRSRTYTIDPNSFLSVTTGNKTDFALGISAGGKFVTKKGFVAEIFLGLGRNFGSNSYLENEIVGRGGITLGYRF